MIWSWLLIDQTFASYRSGPWKHSTLSPVTDMQNINIKNAQNLQQPYHAWLEPMTRHFLSVFHHFLPTLNIVIDKVYSSLFVRAQTTLYNIAKI